MDPLVQRELTCPVCLEVPREGGLVQCPNDHLTCERCFAALAEPRGCPVCREGFGAGPRRSRLAEVLLDGLRLPCKFKDRGCEEKVPRKDLSHHEEECQFDLRQCKHKDRGCDVSAPRSLVQEHEEKCDYRKTSCRFKDNGCQALVVAKEAVQHTANYLHQPVQCPACIKDVTIEELLKHVKEEHKSVAKDFDDVTVRANPDGCDKTFVLHLQSTAGGGHEDFFAVASRRNGQIRAFVVFVGAPGGARDRLANITVEEEGQIDQTSEGELTPVCDYTGRCNPADLEHRRCSGLVIPDDKKTALRIRFSVWKCSGIENQPLPDPFGCRSDLQEVVGDLRKALERDRVRMALLRKELKMEKQKSEMNDIFKKYNITPPASPETGDLSRAIANCDFDAAKAAVKEGADVNYTNKDCRFQNFGLLMKASCIDQLEIVRLLLDHGAHVDTRNPFGDTALHWAAGKAGYETVRELLARSKNEPDVVNARNGHGNTPLGWAVNRREGPDKKRIVPLLKANGATL